MFKVQNEFCHRNISRTIQFTEPILTRLKETAQQNHISVNLLVLQCCHYALNHMENHTKHTGRKNRSQKGHGG